MYRKFCHPSLLHNNSGHIFLYSLICKAHTMVRLALIISAIVCYLIRAASTHEPPRTGRLCIGTKGVPSSFSFCWFLSPSRFHPDVTVANCTCKRREMLCLFRRSGGYTIHGDFLVSRFLWFHNDCNCLRIVLGIQGQFVPMNNLVLGQSVSLKGINQVC